MTPFLLGKQSGTQSEFVDGSFVVDVADPSLPPLRFIFRYSLSE